jgi:hypothetical protein
LVNLEILILRACHISKLIAALATKTAPLPGVPEANAELALIPVVAAMLLFSARRLWRAQRSLAACGHNARDVSES